MRDEKVTTKWSWTRVTTNQWLGNVSRNINSLQQTAFVSVPQSL